MKVVLPEKNPFKKNEIVIYVVILVVCIISIVLAFYVQFFAKTDVSKLLENKEEGVFGEKTEEQTEILKAEFDQIFTNSIENTEVQDSIKKEKDRALVYTRLEKKESKLNSYDIEVHIPYINIDNSKVEEYNKEIEDFINKTNSVIESANKNIIYTVEYVANVQDNILSLMIRSNLKEGSSAQRLIIQTFNYDLKNNKEITLEEILKLKNINKTAIQEKIKNEIEIEQKKVEDLKNLGYNIFSRDVSSDIYDVENSGEFYLTNNTLYIMYAYGNEAFTSEMDLIVI